MSSDSSWASSRSTRGGSGGSWTRYSAGSFVLSSSPATASLAAIIRYSISLCDSVCSDGSRLSTWPSREKPNSGSTDSTASAPRASRAAASASATRRAAASGVAHGSSARSAPRRSGPRAGSPAARRSGSRSGGTRSPHLRALELHLHRHCQPVLVRAPASTRRSRAPRAASAPPARGRRPNSRAGTPRGRAPFPAARTPTRRRCAPTRGSRRRRAPRPRSRRRSRCAVGGSMVNVGQVAQVAPLAARSRTRRPSAPRARRAGRSAAAARGAPSARRARRGPRPGRPIRRTIRARPPRARRDLHEVADALAAARLVDVDPVPALEERRDREVATVLLEDADASPGDRLQRLPQRLVAARSSGSSDAVMSGVMPAPLRTPPPPRLRPDGVKYSPTVMSSAPPLASRSISWKTPLPYVRLPTTFARLRSCSAPVTISDAEAEPSSTSTTTGIVALDRAALGVVDALGARAALRRDDPAVGDEHRGDLDRLVQQPAAVVAQVEHDPLGPVAQLLVYRLLDVLARAGREAGERDPADLLALVALHPALDDRDVDLGALERELLDALPCGRRSAPCCRPGP